MLRKIYKELVAIRKEFQAIRENLEPYDKFVLIRQPYSACRELVKVGTDESLDAK